MVEFPVAPADSASQPAFVMPTPENTDAAVQANLIDLAGRSGVLGFLQLDGFVRRVVATVDNLDRPHAPSRVWPVNPSRRPFTTLDLNGKQHIAPDNAERYDAFVEFVESVDMAGAAALYSWMYPLFQRATKNWVIQAAISTTGWSRSSTIAGHAHAVPAGGGDLPRSRDRWPPSGPG